MNFDETAAVFDAGVGHACPGAAVQVRVKGLTVFSRCGGFTSVDPDYRRPVEFDTAFDLASLTKPLSTALITAAMIDAGEIAMESVVGDVFSDISDSALARLDVRRILLHTAGFPSWLPFARTIVEKSGTQAAGSRGAYDMVRSMISASFPGGPVDTVCYSDVGYILLAMMLEKLSKEPLPLLFEKYVKVPAGLKGVGFRPVFAGSGTHISDHDAAATAWCPIRRRVPQGEVHDDNAWILGGAAGHAGLFGNVSAVADLVDLWIQADRSSGSLISEQTARLFVRGDFTDSAGIMRAPGFDRPSGKGSNAGDLCPVSAVGHLGFTGTSFWFDRESGVSIVLLTDRVNPDMNGKKAEIRVMRRRIYDAAWKAFL